MSVILHLGVLDVAYTEAPGPYKTKQGPQAPTTTFKVASILEKNYRVMNTFFVLRKAKIAGFLADDMAKSIERLVATGKSIDSRNSFTYGADQKIETEFRAFIFSNEISRLNAAITGQAISAAAARGVNHRLKQPYAKANKARPAFVDTGLYVQSFRAWTTADVGATEAVAP